MRIRSRYTAVPAAIAVATLVLTVAPGSSTATAAGTTTSTPMVVGQVGVVFEGTGTYHVDGTNTSNGTTHVVGDAQLTLHSTFHTNLVNTNGILGMAGTTSGTFDNALAGTQQDTETYTDEYGDPPLTGTCSGPMPVAPDAPRPNLHVSRSGNQFDLGVESLTAPSFEIADYAYCPPLSDGQGTAASMHPNVYVAEPLQISTPLPQALTASLQLPVSTFEHEGTVSIPVDSSTVSIPANCPNVVWLPTCSQSLTWHGTVKVTVSPKNCKDQQISSVTTPDGTPLSAEQRTSAGLSENGFHPGQQISAPAGQGIVINMSDGHGNVSGSLQMGPGSRLSVPDDCDGFGQPTDVTLDFIVKKGETWLRHTFEGSKAKFEASPERAIAGTRGSSYTLGRDPKTGAWLMHVIEGDGYAGLPGHRLIDVPAGRGVLLTSTGPRLADRWPAAQRSLVPRTYRPAKITHLVLKGASNGSPRARLRFRTDRSATVLIKVLRGHKVIAHKRVHAHTGTTSVRPFRKHLKQGHYQVRLVATTPQRAVSLASKKLTVR